MCVETIFVAICAPPKPSLSFTCGKIHMIASDRVVCDSAVAQCICHFGTCGSIGRRLDGVSVDLGDVMKIRCAPCAALQDVLAEPRTGHEVIESPLLTRIPVSMDDEAARDKHFAMLKGVWGGSSTCPYHLSPPVADTLPPAPATLPSREPSTEPLLTSDLEAASRNETPAKPDESTSTTTVPDEPEEPEEPQTLAVEDDTEVVTQNMSPVESTVSVNESENDNVKNKPIGPGLESSCWAPKKPYEKKFESAKIVARRAPAPLPKVGPKAREAAKHFSGLRGFLTGQA